MRRTMDEIGRFVSSSGESLVLTGLDGANPLGFMASLGAFRLFSMKLGDAVKMAWRISAGTWHPILFGTEFSISEAGNELHRILEGLGDSVWNLEQKLPFAAARLRQFARSLALSASLNDRGPIDLVASFGVECIEDERGDFKATALRMVRAGDSAGQGLPAYARRNFDSTTPDDLTSAIRAVWKYNDPQCALRWDPAEDRGYAMQWRDPSKIGASSVRGGNCLALAALPLFTTVPVKGRVETMGFGLAKSKKSSFTWPIWEDPVDLDTSRSILGLRHLQQPQPPRDELASVGVIAAYRSDRIMTSTYYANFTPAMRVC